MKLKFKELNFRGLNVVENELLKRSGVGKISLVLNHAPLGPDLNLNDQKGTRPQDLGIHKQGQQLCSQIRTRWKSVFNHLSEIYGYAFDKITYASAIRHQETISWLFPNYLYPNLQPASSKELDLKLEIPWDHDKLKSLMKQEFARIDLLSLDEPAVGQLAIVTGRSAAEIKTKIIERMRAATIYGLLRSEATDLNSNDCIWKTQKDELKNALESYWKFISQGGTFLMSDPVQNMFWGFKIGASSLVDSNGEPILPFQFNTDHQSPFFQFVKPAIGLGACCGALIVFGETGKVRSIQRIGPDPWFINEYSILFNF